MRCFAPRTRAPVQAKKASRPDRRVREERPAALPAGLGTGLSLADVPIHAPPAGLPQPLKAGVERLSGLAMDDVRIHRDSAEPAKLGALAYTQGRDIHLGPGQERHLPHEAWHAVQQMQGRVPATGRLGEAALNEDPALEADADRMGASAGRPGTPPAQLRRAPSQAGPVQRKVKRGGTLLGKSEPMSGVLLQYVQSDVEYILGKDSEADLKALPVHLFDTRIKYLLGENHSSGKWETDTKQWPTTPKMVESEKGIPREKDDTAGTFHDPSQPFALESRHAYLLTELIDVHEYSNKLNAEFATGLPGQDVSLVQLYVDAIHQSLGQVEHSVTAYQRFATLFDSKLHGASARLTAIKTFASNLLAAWSATLKSMMTAAEGFSGFLGTAYTGSMFKLDKDALKAAGTYLTEIAKGEAAISALTAELIGIVGFPRSENDQAVRAFAASSDRDVPRNVGDALNLGRERGMIANIDGVDPPLLVQIGNFHVARVANAARQPAQAIDMTDSLARFTARNSFFEPVVEKQQAARPRR